MENFFHILTRPDNIPIAAMVPLFLVVLVWAWLQARPGPARPGEVSSDKVHAWPYLVRVEFLAAGIVMIVLLAWSILVDAPLEQAANPMVTPNPAKAPWYFLGLQELLVYFDPWIAGVVLPTLIVLGLALIPYLDVNPQGQGRYNWRDRPFAVSTFCFGFLVLGLGLIVLGVFFRGPGWNFFWPWQYGDPNKVVALTNINLPEALGVTGAAGQFLVGAAAVLGWYALGLFLYLVLRRRPAGQSLGRARLALVLFLFLSMLAVPLKVLLRLIFHIKYVWVTPWFNL